LAALPVPAASFPQYLAHRSDDHPSSLSMAAGHAQMDERDKREKAFNPSPA
jgi:hypothetical protein